MNRGKLSSRSYRPSKVVPPSDLPATDGQVWPQPSSNHNKAERLGGSWITCRSLRFGGVVMPDPGVISPNSKTWTMTGARNGH